MEMKKLLVGLVALLLLAMPAMATDGQSTKPEDSLADLFNDSVKITPATKVVIAIADEDDYSIIAMADVVARHEGAPLLITPEYNLTPTAIEIAQQLMTYQNVDTAIVVGVGSNASAVADLIAKISTPAVDLTVSRIIANSVAELSLKVSIYEYTSSSTAVVCDGNVPEDLAKGLIIASIDDIPLLYEQAEFADLNATLTLLGVSTVYTTPAVEATTETDLTDAGYTVNTMWRNNDLTVDVDVLAADNMPSKNATIIAGDVGDFIRAAPALAFNASVLKTSSATTLGTNVSSYLSTAKPNISVILGDSNKIADSVALDIAAATGKKVERMFFTDGLMLMNRLALVENHYVYPIIVAEYKQLDEDSYEYKFRNIGHSDAVTYGDYALKVEFTKTSGEFTNSSVTPIFQNDTVVRYYFTSPIYPYHYATLTFDVTTGTNFTAYPAITYNALTLAGAIINIKSYVEWFISKIQELKSWFIESFETFFGKIKELMPFPGVAATIAAAIVLVLIVWTVVGFIAYVVKAYIFKAKITSPGAYGLFGWLLARAAKGGGRR